MPTDREQDRGNPADRPKPSGGRVDDSETTPNQERGERIDTGKMIARGGKDQGHVPGANESK